MQTMPSKQLNGSCAAEVFFRRMPRGMLPTLWDDTDLNKIMANKVIIHERMMADMKSRENASEVLAIGDPVRIQNTITKLWDETGVIDGVRLHGKSYFVQRDVGRRLLG